MLALSRRGSDRAPQDLSNTQYALLALQAAARCGIEVPPRSRRSALEYLLDSRRRTGPRRAWIENPAYEPGVEDRYGPFQAAAKAQARGWSYLPGHTRRADRQHDDRAGIACLAIVKDRLRGAATRSTRRRAARSTRSMLDGARVARQALRVDENPGRAPAGTTTTSTASSAWAR